MGNLINIFEAGSPKARAIDLFNHLNQNSRTACITLIAAYLRESEAQGLERASLLVNEYGPVSGLKKILARIKELRVQK